MRPEGVRSLLFVYGTLRAGKPLHDVLADRSWSLGTVVAAGYALYTNNGHYPFLASHIGGRVRGELYAVDDETLARCNDIELGAGYSSVVVDVVDQDGVHLPAYAYLGNEEWRRTAQYVGEEWSGGW